MDYIAYDPAHHRVWVPAGNTGSVDVVDTRDEKVTRLEGFATAEVKRAGTKRTVGPSSAAVGEGVVYVGNRGDSSICAVDAATLAKGASPPRRPASSPLRPGSHWRADPRSSPSTRRGASSTRTSRTRTARSRSTSAAARSRRTGRRAAARPDPGGLALDARRNVLLVACTDHVNAIDPGRDGRLLSAIDTGAGIDGIDYVESRQELYAGAARAAKLTVARLDDQGKLTAVATVATAAGARNAVATEEGWPT
jgi:DNA-binding beta-propeller fold protein YncE